MSIYRDKVQWHQESVEAYRKPRLNNLQKAMSLFFKRVGVKEGRYLEIGPGPGFFYANLPRRYSKLREDWIQLDRDEEYVNAARKKMPSGKYIIGTVHKMPFPKESFDVVCGFASFDAISYLHEAMEEVTRVLKPKGIFFNLSDFMPAYEPIAIELAERGYSVNPIFEYHETGSNPFQITRDLVVFPGDNELSESARNEITEAYLNAIKGCTLIETEFKWEGIKSESAVLDKNRKALEKLNGVRKKYAIPIDIYQYFYEKIKQELESDYTDIKTGLVITGLGTDLLRYELTRPIFGLLSRLHNPNIALVNYVAAKKKS
ncbi:MAG: class I SAM-dependent methyltransferase [Candidatus Aenigmarchaeota archaeon]|nr:class I SAM-dependent methyltransferase [Candidatus Aenigmarchaeota archaeon]